jgi:hypothetical protein
MQVSEVMGIGPNHQTIDASLAVICDGIVAE